jgi:hypothetical protein
MADGNWYRDGSVTLTAGSPVVTGNATSWATQVRLGDMFTPDNGSTLYEVVGVDSDTSIDIKPAWTGATLRDVSYAIIRIWGRTLPDQLAAQVAGLLDSVRSKMTDPVTITQLLASAQTLTGQVNAAVAEAEDVLAQIGAALPIQYWFDASGVATTGRSVAIANDQYLTKIRLQNLSQTATTSVGVGGDLAEPFKTGFTLAPGQLLELDYPPTGTVTVKSTEDSARFTCKFTNTSGVNPNAQDAFSKFLLRLADFGSMSIGWRNAYTNLYTGLFNANIIQRASSFVVLGGYSAADSLVDWAGSSSLQVFGTPVWQKGVGYVLNGSTDYLDVGHGLVGVDQFAVDDHAFFCEVSTGTPPAILGSNKPAMSCGTVEIDPNRTGSTFSIRDGSAGADVISGATLDGVFGLNRTDTDGYTAVHGQVKTSIAGTFDTLTSYHLLYGVRPTLGGAITTNTFFTGTIKWGYAGLSLTDGQQASLLSLIAAFYTAVSGLA